MDTATALSEAQALLSHEAEQLDALASEQLEAAIAVDGSGLEGELLNRAVRFERLAHDCRESAAAR